MLLRQQTKWPRSKLKIRLWWWLTCEKIQILDVSRPRETDRMGLAAQISISTTWKETARTTFFWSIIRTETKTNKNTDYKHKMNTNKLKQKQRGRNKTQVAQNSSKRKFENQNQLKKVEKKISHRFKMKSHNLSLLP